MPTDSLPLIAEPDDFARRFSLRGPRLMWLLGAGVSAAASVPTAWDIIWDLKRTLYVSRTRTSRERVADLSNPLVRRKIQTFIDEQEGLLENDAEEYATLFEATFPSDQDRQSYIEAQVASGVEPTYGHVALATLMAADKARLVFTTNFDGLLADACAKVFGTTTRLTTTGLDATELAAQAVAAGRWPVEVKLHGDFRSRRLKNTTEELQRQDANLRNLLRSEATRTGLVVAGYSGRDESVMEALHAALEEPTPYPGGLFWLARAGDEPLPSVSSFLAAAAERGVESALVPIGGFDECLRDLVRVTEGVDTTKLDGFTSARAVEAHLPRRPKSGRYPVVRLNALRIEAAPVQCRRVQCAIGGQAEVQEAIDAKEADVIAVRRREGVLAFGADAAVRKAFDPYGIEEFDLYAFDGRVQAREDRDGGLIPRALSHALARRTDMCLVRRGSRQVLFPNQPDDDAWRALREIVGSLRGKVPGTSDVRWREAISVRTERVDGNTYLLFDPIIAFENNLEAEAKAAAASFGREKTFNRYNQTLSKLLDFWSGTLAGGGSPFTALGVSSGVDAEFELAPVTGFSKRGQA